MAKSPVTYSCGHAGQVVAKNRREAERRAAWVARNACPECERAERDRLHAEENAAAREAAIAAGLPNLIGVSQKQIDYATSMRAKHLATLPDLQEKIARVAELFRDELVAEAGKLDEDIDARIASLVAEVRAELDDVKNETSAKWWLGQGPIWVVIEAWDPRMKGIFDALVDRGTLSHRTANGLNDRWECQAAFERWEWMNS